MADEWYYARGNQRFGPVPLETLRQLVAVGQVSLSDLVWADGFDGWRPASAMPELFGQAAVGPAAPAAVGYYNPVANPPPPYAGFWLRFVAYLVDWLVLLVPMFVVSSLSAFQSYQPPTSVGTFIHSGGSVVFTPPRYRPPAPGIAVAQSVGSLLNLVIGWVYYAGLESSKHQATLGKMALGLRVTDLDGGRIGFGRATGRYFAKWLSAMLLVIGYIMAGLTRRKQALHDMVAGTLVLKKAS